MTVTTPQPIPFFSAVADFASGKDTPRDFLERCLTRLEEFEPAVVSFHFGLPAPELLARVKRLGAKVFASATTVDEARCRVTRVR